jgi:hypothetical protein
VRFKNYQWNCNKEEMPPNPRAQILEVDGASSILKCLGSLSREFVWKVKKVYLSTVTSQYLRKTGTYAQVNSWVLRVLH